MFDWEELESPDNDYLQEKREREIDFLRETADSFVASYREWSYDTILERFTALIGELRAYEREYGQLEYQGYIATRVLPTLALFLCDELQRKLPDSQKLVKEQTDSFLFQFAGLLDPARFLDSFVNIVNYADLLDTTSEPKWSRVLDAKTAGWLQTNARRLLSHYAGNPLPPDASKEQHETRAAHALHLGRIARGTLPFGFNTEHEQQWEMWNMDFLLDPEGDIREEKLVTQNTYNFLLRTAQERLETIDSQRASGRGRLSVAQAEKEEKIYQHLSRFVQTGELPYGYRVFNADALEPS